MYKRWNKNDSAFFVYLLYLFIFIYSYYIIISLLSLPCHVVSEKWQCNHGHINPFDRLPYLLISIGTITNTVQPKKNFKK